MSAASLREKSVVELTAELSRLLREKFKLRLQKESGESFPVHLFRKVRREIARVKTVLAEKQVDSNNG